MKKLFLLGFDKSKDFNILGHIPSYDVRFEIVFILILNLAIKNLQIFKIKIIMHNDTLLYIRMSKTIKFETGT